VRYLVVALLAGGMFNLPGQTFWTGGGPDSQWTTAENWTGGVPTDLVGAVINAVGQDITLAAPDQHAATLSLSGGNLVVSAAGSLTAGDALISDPGALFVQNGGSAVLNSLTINGWERGFVGVYGQGYADTGANVGELSVLGLVFNQTGGELRVAGGDFVGAGLYINGVAGPHGSTITSIQAGGTMTLAGALSNFDVLRASDAGSHLEVSGATYNTGSHFDVLDGATATLGNGLSNEGSMLITGAGSVLSVQGETSNIGQLSVGGGAAAIMTGNFINQGYAGISDPCGECSTLSVSGDFTNGGPSGSGVVANAFMTGSYVTVDGTVLNHAGSGLTVVGLDEFTPSSLVSGALTNNGSLTVSYYSSLTTGDVLNSGTVTYPAGISVQVNSTLTSTGTFTNGGSVWVSGDSSMTLNNLTNAAGGSLQIGGGDSYGSTVAVAGNFSNQGFVYVTGPTMGNTAFAEGGSILDLTDADVSANIHDDGSGNIVLSGGAWQAAWGGVIEHSGGDINVIGTGTAVYLSGGQFLNMGADPPTDISETLTQNHGFLQVDSGANVLFSSGSLLNQGTLAVGQAGEGTASLVTVTGTFENQGTVTVQGPGGGYGPASFGPSVYAGYDPNSTAVLDLTDADVSANISSGVLSGGTWQAFAGGVIAHSGGDINVIDTGTAVFLSGGQILNMSDAANYPDGRDITATLTLNNGYLQVDNNASVAFTADTTMGLTGSAMASLENAGALVLGRAYEDAGPGLDLAYAMVTGDAGLMNDATGLIRVRNGAELAVTNQFVNNGSVVVETGGYASAGAMENGSGATLVVDGIDMEEGSGSELDVYGVLVNDPGGSIIVRNGAAAYANAGIVNGGALRVASGGYLGAGLWEIPGMVLNAPGASLEIDGVRALEGDGESWASMAEVYGTVVNAPGGTVRVSNGGDFTIHGMFVNAGFTQVNSGSSLEVVADLPDMAPLDAPAQGFINGGVLAVGSLNDAAGSYVGVGGTFDNQGIVVVTGPTVPAEAPGAFPSPSYASVLDLTEATVVNINEGHLSGGVWQVLPMGAIGHTGGDISVIDAGTSVYLSGGAILNVELGDGPSVRDITETLTLNNGFLQVDNGTHAVFSAGSLENGATGTLMVDGAMATPPGEMLPELMPPSTSMTVTGQFVNAGVTQVQGGATLTLASVWTDSEPLAFDNSGSLVVTGNSTVDVAIPPTLDGRAGDVRNGSTENLFASVLVAAGSTFRAPDSKFTNFGIVSLDGELDIQEFLMEDGLLEGTGVIHGRVAQYGGTLNPGDPAGGIAPVSATNLNTGTLTVTGDYILGPEGTLEIDFSSLSPGGWGFLAISGTADLQGYLSLIFADGLALTSGVEYQIASYGSLLHPNMLSLVTTMQNLVLDYQTQGLYVRLGDLEPTPEPAAWALALGGVAALLAGRKLRSRRRRERQ
jgi:hypothetical protein